MVITISKRGHKPGQRDTEGLSMLHITLPYKGHTQRRGYK